MTRIEVEEKVFQIVSEVLAIPKEKLTHNSSFIKDLGADSLTILDVMMKCEDIFQLTISDEETENIKTIGNAVDYIFENLTK